MERQDISLGNVPRERKKEKVNLTFLKHKEEMLKQKEQRMEHPDVEKSSLKTRGRS
jgi:hypothetical protein